ncbi:MAG: hypothetical protein ACREDS_11335, partial [Limisphaerales bacterium]
MKKLSGILGILLASSIASFAIEGLEISVQSTNVMLSWPSLDDGSETYIVQYRSNLNASSSWLTLTDNFPAAADTNITFFVHSNSVNYPDLILGGGGSGSEAADGAETIMAMPANGSGEAVPLAIYPPGFDLSGLIIFDPATEEWVSGKGYTISPATENDVQAGGAQPDDGSDDTNSYTGFYRVVRDGAHLYGLTNGTVLSGLVALPIELGNTNGSISTISLTEDDSPVGNSIQTAPLSSPLALIVDTTLMSNGVHEVSASARWDDTNGGLWEADSPPVSVTVSNEISFPDWIPFFGELGNSLLINAQSAHTNVDWYIDVYDSNTNYIGTFGGHTDDGNIQVEWNLIGPPPDYVAYTNDNSFLFYITTE